MKDEMTDGKERQRLRICVAGATGRIGSHLVRVLSERGVAVRALSRDPSRGEDLPGVEWVAADLADRERLAKVFAGAERLFLLTGNTEAMVRLQDNAVRAAEEAGLLHVVKLSALGASDHSKSVIGLWHWIVERRLRSSSLAWTILRPHHFLQNLLDQKEAILGEGVVRSVSGDGKIPFLDTRDISEVAAAALTEPGHGGRTHHLTGPEALSYREVTEILGRALGRSLRYVDESPEEHRQRRRAAGDPEWLIGAQLAIAAYQRAGGPTERTTDTVERILGRPPRSARDFAADLAREWQ